MGDGIALEPARMIEVELLQRFTRREARSPDAALIAVRLAGRYLALQTGHQVFFVAPTPGAGPLSQPDRRLGK